MRWWMSSAVAYRELAVLRVLDERGQVDPDADAAGSRRTRRDKLETARSLESLPEIAAVAYEGALSRSSRAR